ncbi:MAG: double-strand break repair helicase AddA [Hyphomicrobiales bacterium]
MALRAKASGKSPQLTASDPRASVWVSANAGSGKTFVLVMRVLRLLLQPDVRPEQILCLTYTKAAAAEMKNRVLDELRQWAVAPDNELAAKLGDICGGPPDADRVARARRLFAETLDARGGLRIYTIHAFCERLLHRFPLEADVPPAFRVLDDAGQTLLMNDAIDATLARAAEEGGSVLGRALSAVVGEVGEDRFRELVKVALGRREDIREIVLDTTDLERIGEAEELALRALLGVAPGRRPEDVEADIAAAVDDGDIAAFLPVLAEGQKTDRDCAGALDAIRRAGRSPERGVLVEQALLTRTGTARKRLCTRAVSDAHPEIAETLAAAATRVGELSLERAAMRLARATGALVTLADAILNDYGRRKAAHAALDFDDLIERTANLLRHSGAAAWVLYKLDYGIAHILVDESQDTSPAQWRIVEALTGEFFSGQGAREQTRTLFAVGDEKQSIYSFQGARPDIVHGMGRTFRARVESSGHLWEPVQLNVSHRSVKAVLDSVDKVFARPEANAGLLFESEQISHHAHRERAPGLVEIWPVVQPGEVEDIAPFEPHRVAGAGAGAPVEVLAARIAEEIRGWLNGGECLGPGRPVRPGDILILLRKRAPLARPMIRALKERGIPVAGADRMLLAEHIAVKDMAALGDFVLMPGDDLSLAALLKSPLFGFGDDDLFELCHGREGSLWRALQVSQSPRYAPAAARLDDWLGRADFQPPYEFFARILEEPGGDLVSNRHLMLARLGPDAGDALDEFLNLALAHERETPPSLQTFLQDLREGGLEVKRDMEQGRDEVRVMTVHAAKGLEAPIVFLPDCCRDPARRGSRPEILDGPRAEGGRPRLLWPLPDSRNLPAVAAAKETRAAEEMREDHRLLYVAMTRARDRLYVCGWVNGLKADGSPGHTDDCWYALIRDGLKGHAEEVAHRPGRLRYAVGEQPLPDRRSRRDAGPRGEPLPEWAGRPAPPEPGAPLPLQPSRIGEGVEEAGDFAAQTVLSPAMLADRVRFLRGGLTHALLQHLPRLAPAGREEAAKRFLAARGSELTPQALAGIWAETRAILEDPAFAPVFGEGSRAEVPIAALLDRGEGLAPLAISGQIDRLLVTDDSVLIVDYKTNRPPPADEADVAPGYIHQLAAYRLALSGIYPGKSVRAALLWTDGARLMEISSGLLDAAEARIRAHGGPALDARGEGT